MMERLFKNPVFIKELYSKMRQRRTYTVLTVYLIILGFAFYLSYSTSVLQNGKFYYLPSDSTIGKTVFTITTILQMLLLISTLAFSSTCITLEREERTYNLLRVTPLTPLSIVIGKLLFSLAYILLLLIVSIPIAFIMPYLGGLSFAGVLKVCSVMIMTSITLSLLGIYCSTAFQKSSYSTGVFYGIMIVSLLLPCIIGTGVFSNMDTDRLVWAGVIANPFWAITGILLNDATRIFQLEIPISLLSIISNILLSIFIGSLAVNGLTEGIKKKDTVSIRVSFLILFLFMTITSVGSIDLLAPKLQNNFSLLISFQIILFIAVIGFFCFGETGPEEAVFDIKKIFKQYTSTGLIYITLLLVVSSVITFVGVYFGKICTDGYLLCLILSGIFIISLGWGSFGLLLNSLSRTQLASRGLFLFIVIIVASGISLPGMPHYLQGETIGTIGRVLLHLHPIIPVDCLIEENTALKIINESSITFFRHSMLSYAGFFLINMCLLELRMRRLSDKTQRSQSKPQRAQRNNI